MNSVRNQATAPPSFWLQVAKTGTDTFTWRRECRAADWRAAWQKFDGNWKKSKTSPSLRPRPVQPVTHPSDNFWQSALFFFFFPFVETIKSHNRAWNVWYALYIYIYISCSFPSFLKLLSVTWEPARDLTTIKEKSKQHQQLWLLALEKNLKCAEIYFCNNANTFAELERCINDDKIRRDLLNIVFTISKGQLLLCSWRNPPDSGGQTASWAPPLLKPAAPTPN